MFEKSESTTTIIGQGAKLEGDFTGKGDVELYGEIKGSVTISGFIKIGPDAIVTANISAGRAEVAGSIKGKLSVKEDIDILASAQIHGDIKAQNITVAKGARLFGKIATDASAKNAVGTEPKKSAEEK